MHATLAAPGESCHLRDMSSAKPHAVQILEAERDKVAARIERLGDELRDAKNNLRSLDAALLTLTGSQPSQEAEGTLRDKVLMVLPADGAGLTPREIADIITANGRATTNTTVSSILSRLKDDGMVEKISTGWRALLDTAIHKVEKEGDRDERPPGSTGGGSVRERGYPPSAPGGSNPPTSTASKLPNWGEIPESDDDDIPF